MKIIEGLKLIKELTIKAEDLRQKVRNNCAHLSIETPVYEKQGEQIAKWIQSHSDVVKEMLNLRHRINRTNFATEVPIELGGKKVTHTIDQWIVRRRELAKFELEMWHGLTDRNLKEGAMPPSTPGNPPTQVKIIRYYDPLKRDEAVELYRSEPGIIDRTLEVVNATTDLLD
jgi:hypothetical protein